MVRICTRNRTVVLAALLCSTLAAPASAQPAAVQERTWGGRHEITAGIGLLPLDPYSKGLAAELGYAWQFGDGLAWRVIDLRYVRSSDTDLKEGLLGSGQATPGRFEEPELMGSSELVLEPFYGKQSLLNRWDVHMALYLAAGVGCVLMRSGEDERMPRPALSWGGGLRFFLSRTFSLRLEAKDYLVFPGWSPDSVLALDLALALHLGGREP